ncbi:MAG: trypsin-like peptidase domain-containing protein, partial [Cellulomonadaceae bacterium]|nr:trypsin-like peptidase domain-containing protein [Cellulomonadaceae bacterium]
MVAVPQETSSGAPLQQLAYDSIRDLETGETSTIAISTEPRNTGTRIRPSSNEAIGIGNQLPDPQIIIGPDGRYEVTNVNVYPYSTTVFIISTFADGYELVGSGTLVSPTAVLTAAHNFYDRVHGFALSVSVKPGGVRSNFPTIYGYNVVYNSNYPIGQEPDPTLDYGIVQIPSFTSAGFLGFGTTFDSTLINQPIINWAYPGDKPEGTLWADDTGTITFVTPSLFYHIADTEHGSSGSPIVTSLAWDLIVGIHTG